VPAPWATGTKSPGASRSRRPCVYRVHATQMRVGHHMPPGVSSTRCDTSLRRMRGFGLGHRQTLSTAYQPDTDLTDLADFHHYVGQHSPRDHRSDRRHAERGRSHDESRLPQFRTSESGDVNITPTDTECPVSTRSTIGNPVRSTQGINELRVLHGRPARAKRCRHKENRTWWRRLDIALCRSVLLTLLVGMGPICNNQHYCTTRCGRLCRQGASRGRATGREFLRRRCAAVACGE